MNALVPQDANGAFRLAEMMSSGKLVPAHLQKSPGDCLMIIEQAMRWGMSPFAVAQCTSVIQGKLMFEGKLVAAALHSSGALVSRMNYEYSGAGDNRTCRATAMLAGENTPRTVDVVLKDVVTNNGIWKKQPDQQLAYSATRTWARRHAPEVMLGVYAPDEFDEPQKAAAPEDGRTIEGTAEPTPPPELPRRPTIAQWIDALEAELAAAPDAEAVDAIHSRDDVQRALDSLTNGARDRLNAVVKAALDRTAAPAIDDTEVPF